MNPIEENIWNYIDGTCSAEDHEVIAKLIANDSKYKEKYQELLQLNESFNLIDIDEPSMSFTNKVMDKIALQTQPLSAKARIDKRIIYGIAAFFLVSITLMIAAMLSQIDWSLVSATPLNFKMDPKQFIPDVNIQAPLKSTLINGFILFDIVAALMIFDKMLRKDKLKVKL